MRRRPRQWYSKSEFAEAVGLTIRTVNRWDEAGLLQPSRRDADGRYPFDIFTNAWRQRAQEDKNAERASIAEERIRRFIRDQWPEKRAHVAHR